MVKILSRKHIVSSYKKNSWGTSVDRVVKDEGREAAGGAMWPVVKSLGFTVSGWKPLEVCEQKM